MNITVSDSVSVRDGFSRENLVPNPSFEYGFNHWSFNSSSIIATDSFSGGSCLQMIANSSNQHIIPSAINVTPGQSYTLSFYYKVTYNSGSQMSFEIHDTTTSGALLLSTDSLAPASSWTRKSYTFTAPASGIIQFIGYTNILTDLTAEFDAFLLEAGSVAGVYFDGDTSGGVWEGTAGASASSIVNSSSIILTSLVNISDSITITETQISTWNQATSLSFGGTAYVSRALFSSANTNLTFGCWIKLNSTPGGNKGIIANGNNGTFNGYALRITSSRTVNLDISFATSITSTQTLTVGVWYHIVVVRGSTWAIYINGTQNGTTTGTGSGTPSGIFTVGGTNSGSSPINLIDACIDDVRFYERALTDTEVYNWANLRIDRSTLTDVDSTSLKTWWKFDEGSGSTAIDSSGNGNDGTITNAIYVTDSAGPAIATAPKKVFIQDVMSYISRKGNHFYLNGIVWVPMGGSTYGQLGSLSSIDTVVSASSTMGLTILRAINFISVTTTPGTEYTESAWVTIDYLLYKANLAGIKILIDCSDFCGGLLNRGFQYKDQDWTAFCDFLMNRVNTFNYRVYKDDDTLALITVAGELAQSYRDQTPALMDHACTLFKAKGSHQMTGIGATEYYDSGNINQVTAVENLDYLGSHSYESNIGVQGFSKYEFNMLYHQKLVGAYSKVWLIEEFGKTSNYPDTVSAQAKADYLTNHYEWGIKYDCGAWLVWNLAPNSPGSFNISPLEPIPYNVVVSYAVQAPSRIATAVADDPTHKQINNESFGTVRGVKLR